MKTEKADFSPICPYCEKELASLATIDKGMIIRTTIFCCPHCQKILGIGNNA